MEFGEISTLIGHDCTGLDEAVLLPKRALSLSPTKAVLHSEIPHLTGGGPVGTERCGSGPSSAVTIG